MFLGQQSTDFAEKLTSHFFQKVKYQAVFNGNDIANFCHYEQINRFLLFQIYIDWKGQFQKMKHPYFDFQNQEVIAAADDFLNVLSNHIRIEQKDFYQLLDKAVYNTLKLLNEPQVSLVSFFFANKSEISTKLLSQYLPYFHDFDFILQSVLLHCEHNQIQTIQKLQFIAWMDKSILKYEQLTQKSIHDYRQALFAQLVKGFPLNQPLSNPPNTPENPFQEMTKNEEVVVKEDVSKSVTVNVNPNVQKKDPKITKLPLSKQFQFIQKIFKSESDAFHHFVNEISGMSHLSDAQALIQKSVIDRYGIDTEDPIFQDFVSIALYHVL